MRSFDDFEESQKIVYELKPRASEADKVKEQNEDEYYPYDKSSLYYQEGIPTNETDIPFIRLLKGKEPICNMKRRYELYQKNWSRQLSIINGILMNSDREKLQQVKQFVEDNIHRTNDCNVAKTFLGDSTMGDEKNWKVPCAFLNLGSNISNHARLLDQVYEYLSQDKKNVVVRINTALCTSIRKCMKMISYRIVVQLHYQDMQDGFESEDDTALNSDGEGNAFLNKIHHLNFRSKAYRNLPDVEELVQRLADEGKCLIVLIEDADSLPTDTMTRLLSILWYSSSSTRNVSTLIGISTPLSIFQEKISRLVLNILNPQSFNIDNSNEAIENIMENLLLNINDTYNSLIFEPRLVLHFLKMKSSMGISQFYDTMKLIYMNHYFSQPLSILWTDDFSSIKLTKEYFDIFKRLPSLRNLSNGDLERNNSITRKIVDETQISLYKSILEDDDSGVGSFLRLNLNRLINWRFNLKNLIDFLNFMQTYFYDLKLWKNNLALFQLIFENYDYENPYNNMSNFDFLKPIYLNMKNIELKIFNKFLDMVHDDEQFQFLFRKKNMEDNDTMTHEEIKEGHGKVNTNNADEFFENLHHLKDHKDVQKFTKYLNEKLIEHLDELNMDHQPFKEICCIGMNVTDVLKNAFNPSIRDVEFNALLNSREYLLNSVHTDIDKIDNSDPEMKLYKLFEPSMIELYRVYREAGVVINVYDFYQVFTNSITDRERICELLIEVVNGSKMADKEDRNTIRKLEEMIEKWKTEGKDAECEEWNKLTLCWFLEQFAELEIKGMLKEGRGTSGGLEKLIWKDI